MNGDSLPESSGNSERRGQQERFPADFIDDEPEKPRKITGESESAPRASGVELRNSQLQSCLLELTRLSNALGDRFNSLGRLEDLKNAARCQWLTIHLARDIDLVRLVMFDALGHNYITRFNRFGEFEAIDRAIGCQYQALQLTPDGHELKPGLFGALGNTYLCRFKFRGNAADVDQAIEHMTKALQLTPDSHPEWPRILVDLGISYMRRFQRYGDVSDIDRSIECHTRTVRATPDGHVNKPSLLSNLGNSYVARFQYHGDISDADQAINYHTKAVLLAPDGHPEKIDFLNNLGCTYMCRFKGNGDIEDINEVIKCQLNAVQLTPDGHENKPFLLSNLGLSYRHRFERHGDVTDLDQAIKYHVGAVQLIPDNHAEKPSLLQNLGTSYADRFERCGYIVDIDLAIECHIKAVQLTPNSLAARPRLLSRLGVSYRCRFEHNKNVADIDQAIKCQMEAVDLTPEGHADKQDRLDALGASYMRRFVRLREVSDSDRSIGCLMQAVQLTPDGHVWPGFLSNLGNSYMHRFEYSGNIADASKAIEYQMKAVQLSSDDDTQKPSLLNNLGNSYSCRFKCQGDVADISKAIEYHTKAVHLTPDDHAGKPALLDGLGNSYLGRFKGHAAQPLDLQFASKSFEKAALSATGPLRIRFAASHKWAHLSQMLGVSPQPAYRRTVEIASQLVWLGAPIKQRYDLLLELGDVFVEAASWAIEIKDYGCALEWIEQGRAIVWNQILQLRTPVDNLHAANPELAKRLKEVAQALERAGSREEAPANSVRTSNALSLEKDALQHRHLAIKWNQLLQQARGIPGFEDFMRPRTATQLMRAAEAGALVVISIHQSRCDALIIRPNSDNIAHVPLENFSQPRAVEMQVHLMSLMAHRGARSGGFERKKAGDKPDSLKAMLATLWFEVVKPIFEFLGYTHKPPIGELPHVTWCTTGPLSFFPLHAAGCYDGSQRNAFDLAVSSYTPMLSVLLAPSQTSPIASSGILAVGQQFTKGHCNLPYTVHELAAIKERADRVGYFQLDNDRATVGAVLAAMETYSCVHMACHASQHKEDPAQSAFHLHDGDLMLSTITQRSFKNKGLAFLSACQTAAGDAKLPNEAVHLAAGMQMAGYPSVIATMWSIHDEDAPVVAREVYADLLKDGKMDCKNTARALHRAVTRLRERVGVRSFERWLPFIHIGL